MDNRSTTIADALRSEADIGGSVGREFARWHDVAWFQRKLRETPP